MGTSRLTTMRLLPYILLSFFAFATDAIPTQKLKSLNANAQSQAARLTNVARSLDKYGAELQTLLDSVDQRLQGGCAFELASLADEREQVGIILQRIHEAMRAPCSLVDAEEFADTQGLKPRLDWPTVELTPEETDVVTHALADFTASALVAYLPLRYWYVVGDRDACTWFYDSSTDDRFDIYNDVRRHKYTVHKSLEAIAGTYPSIDLTKIKTLPSFVAKTGYEPLPLPWDQRTLPALYWLAHEWWRLTFSLHLWRESSAA